MSFTVTPTAHIDNAAAPNSTYPYSAGMWLRPGSVAAGARFAFSIGENVSRNSLIMGMSGSSFIGSADNGTTGADATAGTGVVDRWSYVLIRWISATNRRIVVWNPDGSISSAQNTTNVTISGITRLRVGNRADNFISPNQCWNGAVADLWYTNTDIQEDGGALTSGLIEQIALRGPFSFRHIAHHICEFHSYRTHIGLSDRFNGREDYFGRFGPQTWTVVGTPTLSAHVPRASSFRGPRDVIGG